MYDINLFEFKIEFDKVYEQYKDRVDRHNIDICQSEFVLRYIFDESLFNYLYHTEQL